MEKPRLTLNNEEALLLVIDVQERINGVMVSDAHAARIELLMEVAKLLQVPMIVTEQYPKGLGSTIGELAQQMDGNALEKDSFSCAREPEVLEAIRATGSRQVLVTGIEAHVCVLQTSLDLLEAGFNVHVPHDAVNSRRAADRDWALQRMMAAGAVISSTESALFELLGRCDTPQFKTVAKLLKKIPV